MYVRNKLLITAFILAGAISLLGLFRLFALRFEKGDMFPPYSSLRSDPLGCKALFLALEQIPGLKVARNYRDPEKLKTIGGRTIYYLGADASLLDAGDNRLVDQLETLAGNGNRLVISFAPAVGMRSFADTDGKSDCNEKPGKKKQQETIPAGKEQKVKPCADRTGRWGVRFDANASIPDGNKKPRQAALMDFGLELPRTLPSHATRAFHPTTGDWHTVYGDGGRALVLERHTGKGSIVLMADSYLLSNEAMRGDRHPAFLAWLHGADRMALFDEHHLGVLEDSGVMALMRKHHFLPPLFALIVLGMLYIWKSAVPFAPMPRREEKLLDGADRDHFSGLVNLLRRNVPPASVLETCHREWLKAFSREIRRQPDMDERIRQLVAHESAKPAQKRDPLTAYHEIAKLLSHFRPG